MVKEIGRFSYNKTITDKLTGKTFTVWVDDFIDEYLLQKASTDFLSDRELSYAYRKISKVYKDRNYKAWTIKTTRMTKQLAKEYGATK